MKPKWRSSNDEIEKMPAIKHNITEELTCFSDVGELWEYNDTTLSVLVKAGQRKALRVLSSLQGIETPSLNTNEEFVFRINKTHLKEIKKVFKPEMSLGAQLLIANKLN